MAITIYHNPRCSKSRQTLALLEQKGLQPEIVKYLETPPTAAELASQGWLTCLGISP
ncbi:MAG: arsenate reductase (glutaredoxin), partial [Thiohalospira sp.]